MPDNPLLELYSSRDTGGNPMLGLYASPDQPAAVDLGDRPTAKAPSPQRWEDLPHPHGVPELTIYPRQGVDLGDIPSPKSGQTVPQSDVAAGMERARQQAIQAAAIATGIADIRKGISGEVPWTEVGGAMIPFAIGGPEGEEAMAVAKAIKNILSPSSTELGKVAAGALRKATGTAARTTEQTRAALIPYDQAVQSMVPEQRLDLLGYMEGRSQGAQFPETIQGPAREPLKNFTDEFRRQMDLRRDRIQSLGIEAGVIEDYVTHFWKDRNAARSFVNSWLAKQGSGKSLKARTIPTIEEGIRAGLQPVTDNPTEIAMRYVTSMDRHLALREMLDAAVEAGQVKYFPLKDVRNVPDGWVELGGMADKVGSKAYAPADWTRIWNNFVSKGVYRNPDLGDAYRGFRNLSNLTTQTILSFSGYHAVAMAKEAIASDMVKGIGQIAGGLRRGEANRVLSGVGTLGKSIVAPVAKARTGTKFRDVYLGRTSNTIDPRQLPEWSKMADVFGEAGGRGVGKEHAFDYTFSNAGSFSTAWKRGWLKAERSGAPGTFHSAFRDAAQKVAAAGGNRGAAAKAGAKAVQTAKSVTEIIGRSMSTAMAPLFEKYIPMLKNGTFADEFSSWLQMNPDASHEQQVAYAAKLIDSIDNRFGEMIQDNIMWHTLLKQSATVGMLSYSWNLGSLRLMAGGGKDILATAGRAFDPTSAKYSPNAAWIVAYPMSVAVGAGIYQYLKTGKPPQSASDLIWPQTGGKAPGFGQRGTVDERAILPGYEKEPFGWYYNGYHEAINKANPFLRMGIQAVMNSNWRDDPIARPDPTVPEWLSDYFNFVLGSISPITAGRVMQGEKPGSAMGIGEELSGIRPAPLYGMDPKGYNRGMTAIETTKWVKKLQHDYRAGLITREQLQSGVRAARQRQMQYGGPQQ